MCRRMTTDVILKSLAERTGEEKQENMSVGVGSAMHKHDTVAF